MEMDNSDQSSDEPNAKRPKMDTEDSTLSTPETKDPFLPLPSDILVKIIAYTPVAQWPSLESVDKNFLSVTSMAWRQLRSVNLDRDFMLKHELRSVNSDRDFMLKHENATNRLAFVRSLETFLQKLNERSPFLTEIRIPLAKAEFRSSVVQLLAQFENLQSITVGYDYYSDRVGIPLEKVAELLESTRSRSTLKEVRLFDVDAHRDGNANRRASTIDRFASSFVNGREIQSPLKLEKMSFTSPKSCLFIRLDTLDTTRLTEVRLARTEIEPEQLTNVIERASNLRRIELMFRYCKPLDCNGSYLRDNKNLLAALASHENLTSIKLESFDCDDDGCMDFEPEFIKMLKTIGRRRKLRELALEEYFVSSPLLDKEEMCKAICEYIPYLQSIRLYVEELTDESVCNIVSLTNLEEIDFTTNHSSTPLTGNAIKKIALLKHLKRLALEDFPDVDEDSAKRLADVASLVDLRIGNAHKISADVFEKWSEGFVSNLRILILTGIGGDERGLIRLLEKAVRLRVLFLEGVITDQSLMAIAKSCTELKVFSVRSTSNEISVQHLQEIVDRCPVLKRLGGFEDEIRNQLKFPKYRKIGDAGMYSWMGEFDEIEFPNDK